MNDHRASHFCQLLKQRERKGGEFLRDIARCVGGNFQVPGNHGSDARGPAEGPSPSAAVPAAGRSRMAAATGRARNAKASSRVRLESAFPAVSQSRRCRQTRSVR